MSHPQPPPLFLKYSQEGNKLQEESDKLPESLVKYNEAWNHCGSDVDRATVQTNRAVVYWKMGNTSKAIELLTEAITLYPDYLEAILRRAHCQAQLKSYPKAFDDLIDAQVRLPAVLADPDLQDNLRQRSERLMLEYVESQMNIIRECRKFDFPSDVCIQDFFRRFYCDPVSKMWKGLDPDMEVNLNPPIDIDPVLGDLPSNPNGFIQAIRSMKDQKFSEVIDHCTFEIDNLLGRYRLEAMLLRGSFYFLCGEGGKAMVDFQAIIDDPKASNQLKSCTYLKYGMLNDFWGSVKDTGLYYSKAEELWKENADVHYHKGINQRYHGMVALDHLNKAVEACPDPKEYPLLHAFRHFIQTSVYFLAGDDRGVKETVEELRAMERDGLFDTPDCYDVFADALFYADDEAAAAACDKAAEMSGYKLYQLKKIMVPLVKLNEDCREAALDKLEMFTDDPNIAGFAYERIAEVNMMLRRYKEGFAAFDKAIQLAPSIYDAKRIVKDQVEYEYFVRLAEKMGQKEDAFEMKLLRRVIPE